jgi:Protein of unknown function (DUF3300)
MSGIGDTQAAGDSRRGLPTAHRRGARTAHPRGLGLWGSLLASLLAFGAVAPLLRAQTPPAPAYSAESPEELEQLVAPIALYPDSLVAQILAASTFPSQVVEADRWLQGNPGLSGDALAQAVNGEPWDESVKALTAFPAVLGNMDQNLSWTSSLGDAYYNQPQDVMAAIQTMRERAQAAGTLESNPQQAVTTDGSDIVIDPVSPDTVYVPAYDPWLVYGAAIAAWPGWYAYPGIWFAGPSLSFAVGIPIGFATGFVWGWHNWNCNWRGRQVVYNRAPYVSRSATFYNRRGFYGGSAARGPGRGPQRPGAGAPGRRPSGSIAPNHGFQGGARPGTQNARGPQAGERAQPSRNFTAAPRSGVMVRPFNGNSAAARGYAAPRGQTGMQSGAFSGYDHGGQTMGFAARGRASLGGGSPARAAPARSAPARSAPARSSAAPRGGGGARPAGRR